MKKKIIKNIILFAIIIIFINLIQKFLISNINAYSKIELIISYIRMKKEFKRNVNYLYFIKNKIIIVKKFRRIKNLRSQLFLQFIIEKNIFKNS